MAKRRRVKPKPSRPGEKAATVARDVDTRVNASVSNDQTVSGSSLISGTSGLDLSSIAIGLLGGAIVYVCYYPSDSVSVEKGEALWFGMLAIVIAILSFAARLWVPDTPFGNHSSDDGVANRAESPAADGRLSAIAGIAVDVLPWLLAAWMMAAAFLSSPPGNLRASTNEAWLWVSAAAVFTAARWLTRSVGVRKALLVLFVVCATGLSVHGMHQYLVSLPANRAEYERDPDRILQLAGVDAPLGSAERMVFENRLFDGGPTGTFALANSLAAVLLVGVLLSAGVLRFHWRDLNPALRIAWGVISLLCFSCLLAARSRSATLATFIGLVLLFFAASSFRRRNPKVMLWGVAGFSALGLVGALLIALLGNREWFEEAPASLAFRIQYWRSTWQLVLDRPWFGAGPGNFQSIYERYREASAHEQIAEPHNWIVETLASGGFIGLLILLVTIFCGLAVVNSRRTADQTGESESGFDDRYRWLWLGSLLGLMLVWLIGLASRHPPDMEASIFAVPAALLTGFILWPSITRLASKDIDSIVAVALVSLLIHLMVSGGWTVPGVAMLAWLGAASLTRIEREQQPHAPQSKRWLLPAACLAGAGLLAALYFMSLRPSEKRQQTMISAASAQTRGQLSKAQAAIEEAVDADPWSPDAVLWLADTYRWSLILDGDEPGTRKAWESSLKKAKRIAGDDPAIYRMIGAQQLHVYQRLGVQADLNAAAKTFGDAARWSPSNEWLAAQLAVVARARGDAKVAKSAYARAVQLSEAGGNIERALSRQQVYVAEPLGSRAASKPVRRRADDLLSEPKTGE